MERTAGQGRRVWGLKCAAQLTLNPWPETGVWGDGQGARDGERQSDRETVRERGRETETDTERDRDTERYRD